MGRYNINERWAVAVEGAYGRLEGGNPDIEARRNLSFHSSLWEGMARVEFNFVPFGIVGKHFRTTPFLFCGLGFFCFNPKASYVHPISGDVVDAELQPLHTEGQGTAAYPDRSPYSLLQVMMPFGMGFKAALSKSVSFSLEYGFRKTWTDYIDDVSTTYVGSQVLGSGSLAATLADRSGEVEDGYVNAQGIKRGDDSLKDWYAYFNISFAFSLETLLGWTKSKKCEQK